MFFYAFLRLRLRFSVMHFLLRVNIMFLQVFRKILCFILLLSLFLCFVATLVSARFLFVLHLFDDVHEIFLLFYPFLEVISQSFELGVAAFRFFLFLFIVLFLFFLFFLLLLLCWISQESCTSPQLESSSACK